MLENMTKRVAYSALHLDLLVITLTVVIREKGFICLLQQCKV